MKRRLAAGLSLVLALSSCASIPPPPPEGPGSAGVCIELRTRVPIGLFKQKVDEVVFARLSPGVSDARNGELFSSNHVDGEYLYLLNAPPGEYVAVLAVRRQRQGSPSQGADLSVGATDYTTFFDEDLIRTTRTTVVPGEIAFMGAYAVDQSVGLSDADSTQLHFFRKIAPGAEHRGYLSGLLSGDYHYRGTLIEASHGTETEMKFRKDASAHLAESGWASTLAGEGPNP